MLHIFVPPHSLRSGNDVIGPKTAVALSEAGMPAQSHDLWPEWIAGSLESGKIPLGRRFFRRCLAKPLASHALSCVKKGDEALVLGFAEPYTSAPILERDLKARGGRYIFYVMDDWFSQPDLEAGAIQRCKLADLIIVPTPALAERVGELIPGANIVKLEEPIDVERVRPLPDPHPDLPPLLVWCGNPGQLFRLDNILEALNSAHRHVPFRFRVISGKRPKLNLNFPWEWKRYDYNNESELLAGGVLGLAPLDDGAYERCKGAYKIKTYMAAGLATIASPVGYQTRLIQEGATGLFARSRQEWTDTVLEAAGNPGKFRRMGGAARDFATRNFSHSCTAPHWAAALRDHLRG